jgi:CDGSH-type Zn-finger protein
MEVNIVKATIKPVDNGPYLIAGDFEVRDGEDKALDSKQLQTVALCRCGQSANKPFCDGSHSRVNFKSEVRATPNK